MSIPTDELEHWTDDSCLWRCVLVVMVLAVLVVLGCLSLPHVLT